MPDGFGLLLITVLVLAVGFDYINGFHDTANAIATSVSTRALRPSHAILMSAAANFLGALTGTAVAKTIASGIATTPAGDDGQIVEIHVYADRRGPRSRRAAGVGRHPVRLAAVDTWAWY